VPSGQPAIRKPNLVTSAAALSALPWPVISAAACLLAMMLTGCSDKAAVRPGDIRTYTIPKNAEPTPLASAEAEAPPKSGPRVRYEVPEGWADAGAGAGGIRLATLLIGNPADKREVTIIPASGTLQSNIERWHGQLVAEADEAARRQAAAAAIEAAETVDVEGREATIVLLHDQTDGVGSDEASKGGAAILGAMIPVDESSALFVKFKGDAHVAVRERANFIRFVSSIRLER
jgi:hypothetical protein